MHRNYNARKANATKTKEKCVAQNVIKTFDLSHNPILPFLRIHLQIYGMFENFLTCKLLFTFKINVHLWTQNDFTF